MKTHLTDHLRVCLREPIPAIEAAAARLELAAIAHLSGQRSRAGQLIDEANDPAVRDWTESLWGKGSQYAASGPFLPTPAFINGVKERMPSAACQRELHGRDGYYCRFCGIPVVRKQIREYLRRSYPETNVWGRRNCEQHAALQCMWAQYDHLVPHSRGGDNSLKNLVVTCAPCNYGRMQYTLEEAGLQNPLERPARSGSWQGLENLLSAGNAA